MSEKSYLFVEQDIEIKDTREHEIGVLILDVQFIVTPQAVAYRADSEAPNLKRQDRKDLIATVQAIWDEITTKPDVSNENPLSLTQRFVEAVATDLNESYRDHPHIHFLSLAVETYASVFLNQEVYLEFQDMIDEVN